MLLTVAAGTSLSLGPSPVRRDALIRRIRLLVAATIAYNAAAAATEPAGAEEGGRGCRPSGAARPAAPLLHRLPRQHHADGREGTERHADREGQDLTDRLAHVPPPHSGSISPGRQVLSKNGRRGS